MTPDAIRDVLATHYPQLIAVPRTSPDGWSFFLGEVRRGPNPTRIFHANRASAHAVTKVRLPVSKRVKRDGEYYDDFTGDEAVLRMLVEEELRLYQQHFGGHS